ncbi:hypothetical protein BGZ47_000420 [Haplosporangium gracile]|nr:hypothetical protein BGZ47_000420 [Haplosporangium gracile]
MTTLPIDIAALDGNGLTEAQEFITIAFADLQDQLPPIDANQGEAGDDDEGGDKNGAGDEDGAGEEDEGSTNDDTTKHHERFLGTKFTFQKPWKHTSKSAVWHGYLHTDHYRCHRYGAPRKKLNVRKHSGQDDAVDEDNAAYEEGADGGRVTRDDVTEKGVDTSEGVTMGKRKRSTKRTSIRVGCHSRLACLLLDKDRPNGSPLRVYRIIYTFQHNHPIAKMDELGTQYLSQEQKDKIKRLLQEGSPVRVVLERMRANARKLAQHGKTRIFRDDIITYEDVYNVHHKIMAQEVHKDTDSEFSAHK